MIYSCILMATVCAAPIDGSNQGGVSAQMPQPHQIQIAQATHVSPQAATASTIRLASVPPDRELLPPSQPFKYTDLLGQWKLNDGSTTTGVVQITEKDGQVVMQVISETRYRVDWTPFGPPFATNWSLLNGTKANAENVTWLYSDTVPGCWTAKKVPVNVQMTADKRRVDFQVASFKAFTCQPDEKAPFTGFKLTRQ